jgi:pimeloyl-ACP methyl ester carboxylesterase
MPTAHLNGIDVYYEVCGSGPRLLAFNGSGATIESAAPMIERLSARFEVLIHDQRCLGLTTVPDAQPTMADYAADAAALLDHVGWPTTRVFGMSFGGMVAQEFAVTWPERVERLALLCTSPGGAGGSSFPLHTLSEKSEEERDRLWLWTTDSRYTPEFLAEHPFDRMIVAMMTGMRNAPKAAATERGEAMQIEARRHHDVWDRLSRITCPTLIAYGRYDMLAPPSNSEAIAGRIAGSELHGYEGGHLFAYQDPTAWGEIMDFIARS